MTRELTYGDALREALREEMHSDKSVILLGEDIGPLGGAFGVTAGLLDEFGTQRVMETPISESATVGAAVGAASLGMRPVVEIMYADFLPLAMDHLVNTAAKARYVHAGNASIPLVVRTACGGADAVYSSQSFEAWFMHVPGLKVVMPSSPHDAKGLLKAAIRDPDPVLFFEHKDLYGTRGTVPEEEYTVELGRADVKRKGSDVTVVAFSIMVGKALEAAEILADQGVSMEVIDLRTLNPLNKAAILSSVKKTGKLVIAHESPLTAGPGAEIAAIVSKEAFGDLAAPIERVANPDIPVPFSQVLQRAVIPNSQDILAAVESVMAYA